MAVRWGAAAGACCCWLGSANRGELAGCWLEGARARECLGGGRGLRWLGERGRRMDNYSLFGGSVFGDFNKEEGAKGPPSAKPPAAWGGGQPPAGAVAAAKAAAAAAAPPSDAADTAPSPEERTASPTGDMTTAQVMALQAQVQQLQLEKEQMEVRLKKGAGKASGSPEGAVTAAADAATTPASPSSPGSANSAAAAAAAAAGAAATATAASSSPTAPAVAAAAATAVASPNSAASGSPTKAASPDKAGEEAAEENVSNCLPSCAMALTSWPLLPCSPFSQRSEPVCTLAPRPGCAGCPGVQRTEGARN